ncbi:hypothetical protein CLPUN_49150 [Clostridium puniceum]|uniref:Membrane protein YesL n=1 Tax=Clostridium puniceum TaxID=29367 RepID=A0A1S8T1Z9_9CLOT|nr:YesL family protein [Clostridium puniceum]OOM71634.1 hypothetical protein CLPUN_49150 [Clostridium puniceum]
MKKEFYDKPLYSISNYVIAFLLSSIYLTISNILLIVFFIFTAISPNSFNLLLCFICLIPLGPSLGALYSTTGKVIREKDIYFSSYFWNTYKTNFISNLKLWMIELIAITILFIDFQYFYLHSPGNGIYIIFIVLIVISLIVGFYAFAINSRFELKLKDLLVLSLYYVIKKFPVTIIKIAVIVLGYFVLKNVSIVFISFLPTMACIIFYFYDKVIFAELENKFMSSNNDNKDEIK